MQLAGRPRPVNIVTLDPHRGFANAIGYHLGHATPVADHWHAIRLANACVDDVRRRVQHDTLGHRGRTSDPLYGVGRVLLKAAERLTDRHWRRLEAAWTADDPRDEVYNALAVKELLHGVYAAATIHDARAALGEFYDWATSCGVPETTRLARTVRRWETEILAWRVTGGASNGPTEAVNLLIKRSNAPATVQKLRQLPAQVAPALRRHPGKINPLHVSGDAIHAQRRRAGIAPVQQAGRESPDLQGGHYAMNLRWSQLATIVGCDCRKNWVRQWDSSIARASSRRWTRGSAARCPAWHRVGTAACRKDVPVCRIGPGTGARS
jgi:hypothetical protein